MQPAGAVYGASSNDRQDRHLTAAADSDAFQAAVTDDASMSSIQVVQALAGGKQRSGLPVRTIIFSALVIGWIAVGLAVLCTQEDMEFVTALYVLAQILTTIGYGDVQTQSSDGMKWFLSFHALTCIIVVAGVVTTACDYLLDAAKRKLTSRVNKLLGGDVEDLKKKGKSGRPLRALIKKRKAWIDFFISFVYLLISLILGTVVYGSVERCTCSYGKSAVEDCVVDNCEATGGYVKSYLDAWYMSCISLTTVGFGDVAPKTLGGRAFAVIWMTVGVVVVAHFEIQLSKVLLEVQRSAKSLTNNLDDLFDEIDSDKSGELSRYEFVVFAMREWGLLDKTDLEQINEVFNKLDKDGSGKLSRQEINARYGLLGSHRKQRRWQKAQTAI